MSFAFAEAQLMQYLKTIEAQSTHPIAQAIINHNSPNETLQASEVKEIAGKGLTGIVAGKQILVGNKALMKMHNINIQINKFK